MPQEIGSNSSSAPVYDVHLYEKFREVGSFQGFQYLEGSADYRNEQRNLFLEGKVRNPQLDLPKLDMDDIQSKESNLVLQKQDLLSSETNEVVRQAYRWRLNEKIAEARMLQAAARGDMRRFQRYNQFIYGTPSPDIFAYTVNSIRRHAQESLGSEGEELK